MEKIFRLVRLVKDIGKEIKDDSVAAYSAQSTLFMIISAFPFIMLLLTILQYTSLTESAIISYITSFAPTNIGSVLISWISEVYKKGSGTIISVAAVSVLWSSSKGFQALLHGLNSVYDIEETRNYFKVRLLSAFYTVIFAILLVITLTLLVFGNKLYLWLYNKIPILDTILRFIISFRVTASFLILLAFFLLIFLFIPNRKSRIGTELPGAFIATIGWLGYSYLYSFYYDHFGQYSSIYGSLTSIVLLMLWLYFCMNILFFGAEINAYLKKSHENEKRL